MTALTDAALDALVERLISKDPMVVMLAGAEAADAIRELRAEVEALRKRFILGNYINAAHIGAADVPHVVVEKLQAAIDAAMDGEK